MLSSKAALGMDQAALGMDQAALDGQLLPLLRRVHGLGVVHMDVRGPNVLWCEETRRVMLVDFERSISCAAAGERDRDPVRERVVQFGKREDLYVAGLIIEPPSREVYPYCRF
ncbi:predicted protein [Chaetomium globosum CBS 148.51]|uniref:Protein kinase domain-containing protein n=1 Tax=Chaetomium globosum (strain ATCC 6205 / CBS 148.51 / DSM 1962 / NBRC 6347 / NRRL 1970) TaxID=306901 RepID=Q2GVI9_CHAGB|nr:uncharacterized protein CHGG_08015 [Chaetomium globosum CBS 148.51]EAQ86762.1 predicted protein [Chaetomium globosum CBS 148.51]